MSSSSYPLPPAPEYSEKGGMNNNPPTIPPPLPPPPQTPYGNGLPYLPQAAGPTVVLVPTEGVTVGGQYQASRQCPLIAHNVTYTNLESWTLI